MSQPTDTNIEHTAGLHHLAACVHDLEKAKTFYGELLGLKELPRPADVVEQFESAW